MADRTGLRALRVCRQRGLVVARDREYLCTGVEHPADVGADAVLDVVEGSVVPVRVPRVPAERLPTRRRRHGRGGGEEEEQAEEDRRPHHG